MGNKSKKYVFRRPRQPSIEVSLIQNSYYRSHKKSSRRRSTSPSSDEADERKVRKENKKSSTSRRSRSPSRERRRSRSRSKQRDRSRRDHDKPSSSSHRREARDKKKKKRSNSSSSSCSSSDSSASSAKSLKLMQKLESARLQDAIERKRRKEAAKALETPEEKRARRLKEKQAKEMRRRERMGWDNEYQHYTNQDNPFGDANLTSTFVWSKKLEKKGLTGLTTEELEIINRQKQMENKAELEKVKKRRQERELERMQREDEMALLQRSREAAQFEEYERQESKFHLEQARLRSKIRIQDGRAKPIDLLAQYISNQGLEESIEMQMHEPYTYLNGLNIQDLEDLLEDIDVYMELDMSNENGDYWEDLKTIVRDELQKLKKLEGDGEVNATVGNREGIHQSVARDVTEIFRGKSAQELVELKRKIESKIESKSDGVDVGYWESLLSQLKAHMARARLRDQHQENLRNKLAMLKQEQSELAEAAEAANQAMEEEDVAAEPPAEQPAEESDEEEKPGETEESEATGLLSDCFTMYAEGNYSPRYLQDDELEPNIQVIDDEELETNIEKVRNKILNRGEDEEDFATKEEIRMAKECRKGMNMDEAEFSVETKLDSEVYLWSDKYRPRKPRYFNRVHTGFEWNKYNQTHYDMDNPPPKIVQGYKFNIFYPDLIDKSSTPKYFLVSCGSERLLRCSNDFLPVVQEPCADNKDFAVLRFSAGPPYEDLAFKIVNREWEFSYKRGFRCQFHNNIFQLWFHFKRYRYRR